MLKGKHILIGVTGSIAAYKAAILVRLLVKNGAEVKVIMTEMSKQFITPLTLATLSKNSILVDFFDPTNGSWNSHISLGCWADLYLIAPASANTLAKMACGVADNLLLTTYLSARCPVMAAPAMDLDMFSHSTTQANIEALKKCGVHIIEPASGELASGLDGKGRMEEPEKIVEAVEQLFTSRCRFSGKKVLVTAGPTREALDPVRYISNYSTGKMGYAIAEAFAAEGAQVTIVSGPVSIQSTDKKISVKNVVSAGEMYESTLDEYNKGADIVVLCAAVSDFTPAKVAADKIKSSSQSLSIELEPTKDIAAAIGRMNSQGSILVGFALESDSGIDNAKEKLLKKNLDIIVLNSLKDEGAGFATDTNKVTLFFRDGSQCEYPLQSKSKVARDIIDNVVKII